MGPELGLAIVHMRNVSVNRVGHERQSAASIFGAVMIAVLWGASPLMAQAEPASAGSADPGLIEDLVAANHHSGRAGHLRCFRACER